MWPPPPDPHNNTGGDQEGDKRKKRCGAEVEYLACQMCGGNRWCDKAEEKAIIDDMKDPKSGDSCKFHTTRNTVPFSHSCRAVPCCGPPPPCRGAMITARPYICTA